MPDPEPPPVPPETWHKQQIQTEMGDPKVLKLILNEICGGEHKYILKRVRGNRWLLFSERKLTDTDIENIQTGSYRSRSQAALGLTTIRSSRGSAANSREPSPAPVQRTESMALRAARAAKNWRGIFFRVNAVRNLTGTAQKVKENASNV